MGTDRLRSITVDAASVPQMTLAMIEIERVMRREHKVRPGGENDFQIRNQSDILATFQDTAKTFTYLLAGIAAVSLFVGGIGIMNIMLVAVTERTREIGIRRAIGARRKSIMIQFLLESSILSSAGGCVGVVGGILLTALAGEAFGWSVPILPAGIALALGSSVFVGIASGIYPARRASLLNLVESLRFE